MVSVSPRDSALVFGETVVMILDSPIATGSKKQNVS